MEITSLIDNLIVLIFDEREKDPRNHLKITLIYIYIYKNVKIKYINSIFSFSPFLYYIKEDGDTLLSETNFDILLYNII